MTLTALALAAALLAPAATPSETDTAATPARPAAPSASAPPAAKPDEPKKVCVVEPQLGSHFRKRICATPQEWEERRLRDAAEMAKAQSGAQCRGQGC